MVKTFQKRAAPWGVFHRDLDGGGMSDPAQLFLSEQPFT